MPSDEDTWAGGGLGTSKGGGSGGLGAAKAAAKKIAMPIVGVTLRLITSSTDEHKADQALGELEEMIGLFREFAGLLRRGRRTLCLLPELLGLVARLGCRQSLERGQQGVAWKAFRRCYAESMEQLVRIGALGRGMRAVAVNGDVYPCHRFVGLEEMRFGHLSDYRAGAVNDYHRAVVENLPACRSCWARYFCGGGCFYDNLARSGDMHQPDPDVCREMQTVCEDVICGWCALGEEDRAYVREQVKELDPELRP